jgi:hypothetical protein
MFKKKAQKSADRAECHDDLAARLSTAQDRLSVLRTEAISAARNDPEKLATHAEIASRIEFEVMAIQAAIEQAEREREEAEEISRAEAETRQRQQTAGELHTIADTLEKASEPIPADMRALQDAIAAAAPIVGPNGLGDLAGNLAVEIPNAIGLFAAELRARAGATLAGTAPATLPAAPTLMVITEPLAMPEITVFSLQRLSWSVDGRRQDCGAYQTRSLPVEAANIAMARGLAIAPDSDRYKQMREEAKRTGWPHILDNKTYDLARDQDTEAVYSNSGKFLRYDRGPTRQVSVKRPEI